MDPEAPQGGSFMQQKWFGLPAPVVILGLALIAYFLFMRNSSSSSAAGTPASSAGGGDTLTTGNTTVDTGAVQVTVSANSAGGQPGDTGTGSGKDSGHNTNGWYWHHRMHAFTFNGQRRAAPAGNYRIGNRTVYWHPGTKPQKFTLPGKPKSNINPPSGLAKRG